MHTKNDTTPKLVIKNCKFEYFLNGYESLINVETNNYYLQTDD
jgi:hypothetical protein